MQTYHTPSHSRLSAQNARGETDGEIEAYPIWKQVNRPRNEGPELIKRVEPERTTLFE